MTFALHAPVRRPDRRDRLTASSLLRAVAGSVRDVLTTTDPGRLRLRLGTRAAVAVLLVVAVQRFLAPAVGLPTTVALLLGGVVCMIGSFASSGRSPRDAAVTLAAFPLVALAGVLPATLLRGHRVPELAGFVVVMTGAVFVRRFGPRGFSYGMLAWLSYFFAVFVGFRPGQVPAVLAVVAAATCCLTMSAAVLVPDRPERLVAAGVQSFRLRVDRLLAAGHDALTGALAPERAGQVLHGRVLRVVEAALLVDGYLAGHSPRDIGASGVRRGLLEAELAAEELASAAGALALADDVPPDAREVLVRGVAAARAQEWSQVGRAADELEQLAGSPGCGAERATRRRLLDAAAALRLLCRALDGDGRPAPPHVGEDYEPAVALFLGNLPGSAGSATGVLETGTGWWSRRSLNTRLCVQVALAASLTVVAGSLLSSQRYYFAVLACFLTMTGTVTTGETVVKGASRVLGTVAGLAAATVAVHVTGRNDTAIVVVTVVCVFLGVYLFRVSYVFTTFAVTTVVGELYNVLREFSSPLLLLRLEETMLGAAIAIAVAVLVLPIRTGAARAAAERGLLDEVAALLDDLRDRLAVPERASDLYFDVRSVDARLHQLVLVSRPVGGPNLAGIESRSAVRDLRRFTAVAHRARALAVAVSGVEPGSHPELAARCAALARALRTGDPSAAGDPAPGEAGVPADRRLRELASVAVPLAAAVR